MKRFIITTTLGIINYPVYADNSVSIAVLNTDESSVSSNQDYIHAHNFLQNPYLALPSGGGANTGAESALATPSLAQRLFSDGNYNLYAAASYVNQSGANNYGYGANLFAQTGQIGGFSVGTFITAMNPWFSNVINPTDPMAQAQTLPIDYQVNPQELFLEYQYQHIFQADIGYIGIANSPWLTNYQNNALNLVTYQGALLNLNPGAGFLVTALAFDQAQLLGENGFSRQNMYNTSFDYGTGTANVTNQAAGSTMAMGVSWNNPSQTVNARLWGYQFNNYASLAYADTTLKLPPIAEDLQFSIAAQGAMQSYFGTDNYLINTGYGDLVRSNMLGLQLALDYKILSVQLGYNTIWGPHNAYEGGGLVSPYTYQLASDPLYTTSWMQGMVEKSAGQAVKLTPALNLLDGNLVISPSYAYYATSVVPSSREYDLTISYQIPQVKGLTVFGGYGFINQAAEDGSDGNTYQWQLMASYLY